MTKWPEILRLAQEKGAMILFGDEVSFAQWGSLAHMGAERVPAGGENLGPTQGVQAL